MMRNRSLRALDWVMRVWDKRTGSVGCAKGRSDPIASEASEKG